MNNILMRINDISEKLKGTVISHYSGIINGNYIAEQLQKYATVLSLLDSVELSHIIKEMRSEHDKGDGHFSTHQVEQMEALLKFFNNLR